MDSKEVYLKLDKMSDRISELCVTSAKMEVDLRHHVEGNVQNRRHISAMQKDITLWKGVLITVSVAGSILSPIMILALKAWLMGQ